MSNVTAIVAVIQMCMTGPINADKKCNDGSEPFMAEMTIMNGTTADGCVYKWENIHKCVYGWDNVVLLKQGDKTLFELKPDGSSVVGNGFTPDAAAQAFMRSVGQLLNQNVLNK